MPVWRWPCSPRPTIGQPSRDMQVVGITGTNGKTTTAYLVALDLRCGRPSHAASSARSATGSGRKSATRRTRRLRPRRFRALLREMADRGCGACAMEVSSHALALSRVDDTRVRRGRVHQPDPRSPRLPRRHGELLPGEAPAVRDAAGRCAGAGQPRRPARAGDRRGGCAADRPTRSTAPADITPGRCRSRSKVSPSTCARRAARFTHARRSSDGPTSTTSSRRSRWARLSACRSTRSSGA